MKVSKLIELLSSVDQDGEVYLMTQSNYPLQYRIDGVATQADIDDVDRDAAEEDAEGESEASRPTIPERSKDVFLTEGSQVGYGDRLAWEVSRRE